MIRDLPLTECTVPALLDRQADQHEAKELLRVGSLTRSYREVRDAAARTAGMLAREGVRQDEHVAMWCGNRVELLDLILGCAWMGATAVPLNTALRGEGLRHALADSGSRILVAESRLISALGFVERPDSLDVVWTLDGVPDDTPAGYPVKPFPAPGTSVPATAVAPSDTMAILYTSGTTGVSKGVCCPHAQFYWWGANVCDVLEITERDVLYTCLPLFHTNALNSFAQAMVAGASYVLGGRFSASAFWHEVRDAGATVTYLLGAMVNILASREPGPEDRAHQVRTALAPATPATLCEPFRQRFGMTLVDGFGSTETNMVIGARPGEQRPGYLGRVLPGFEAQVVDQHDVPVADGTPGELVLRQHAPFAFATGYYRLPDKTVESWRNLWFHTGDRVVREPDGWWRFLDRIKDAIRRRGENISSFEVEQVIGLHPAVRDVAVYAVPSEMAEDEVMATVVTGPGHIVEAAELVAHCEPRLAYFAIPRYIDLAEELPLTTNGKVRKSVLREIGVTATTWDREAHRRG